MSEFLDQEECHYPSNDNRIVHHVLSIVRMSFMGVSLVRVIMRVIVMIMRVTCLHVRNGVEEHISKETSNGERNQIVKERFFDPGRRKEEDVETVDEEDRDDGDKESGDERLNHGGQRSHLIVDVIEEDVGIRLLDDDLHLPHVPVLRQNFSSVQFLRSCHHFQPFFGRETERTSST
jgi:uncharacterized membrane protein